MLTLGRPTHGGSNSGRKVNSARTGSLQTLRKGRDADRRSRIVDGLRHEHADTPHPVGLLRARRERPGDRRAAEQGDEIATPDVSCHLTPLAEGVVRPNDSTVRSGAPQGQEGLSASPPRPI
jgi:hypothetical protein